MNFINVFRDKLIKGNGKNFYNLSNIYYSRLEDNLVMQNEFKMALALLIKECRRRRITYNNAMSIIDNLVNKFNTEYKEEIKGRKFATLLDDFDFGLLFNKERLNIYIDMKLGAVHSANDLDNVEYYFTNLVRSSVTDLVGGILGDGYVGKLSNISGLSDEELKKYTEFTLIYPYLNSVYEVVNNLVSKISELKNSVRLKEFEEDEEFMKDLDKIMSHDKQESVYYYHGAQDVYNSNLILEQGLLMMSDILTKTSFPEFTKESLLLYEWSTCFGVIGKDAVVVVDRPLVNGEEMDIVTDVPDNTSFNFSQSGLSGVNGEPKYMVPPEYIVGFVNKRDKRVIFNPKYYKYEELIGENKGL